jgi:hypothetical protein
MVFGQTGEQHEKEPSNSVYDPRRNNHSWFDTRGILRTQTVLAQQPSSVSNGAKKQRWEYCAIVDSYGMNDTNGKPAEGFAKLGYFDDQAIEKRQSKCREKPQVFSQLKCMIKRDRKRWL